MQLLLFYTTRYILHVKHLAAFPLWVYGGLQAAFGLATGVRRYRSSDHHSTAVLTHRHRTADEADPIINPPQDYLIYVCLRNFLALKLRIFLFLSNI